MNRLVVHREHVDAVEPRRAAERRQHPFRHGMLTRRIAGPVGVDDQQRQPQRERRAAAVARARSRQRPAVQLRQVLRDRKAEPEAAVLARERRVRLPEPVEHERQEVRRDPHAGVADGHLDVRVDARERAPAPCRLAA